MKTKVDFIATLKYKTLEEGGRSTPAFSGYRPTIKFQFSDMQTSGIQNFMGCKKVSPGEIVKAEINILSVDYFNHQLYEGLEFDFREGPNIIGSGNIIKILNLDLMKNT